MAKAEGEKNSIYPPSEDGSNAKSTINSNELPLALACRFITEAMQGKFLAKANNGFHSFNPPAKAGGNAKSTINSNELPLD